jgi:nicotinate phosphoribosyltransferase
MKATKNLAEGILWAYETRQFPWDFYFMAMAEADWRDGRADMWATKSFFIRKAPFGGSYCLLGGITEAIVTINELRFDTKEFQDGAVRMGSSPEFVAWLSERKNLQVRVIGGYEGTVFFPNEPIVTVQGPLADIRLVEGILTYALNFSSLSLTKWFRVVQAARPGQVLDFSLRRAQNSRRTSLNAILAGCFATSNCDIAEFFDVPVVGTMGHEGPMSYGDVKIAFEQWLEHQPGRPIGLVDTLQCLEHDFPIWLDTVYKYRDQIKAANPAIWGWRDDSGDLGYLGVEQYQRFFAHRLSEDPWFCERLRMILTNELDEYTITAIINQIRDDAEPAGLDVHDIRRRIIWAAGTNPGVCNDQPSLGGIAKLMEIEGEPTLKLALDSDGNPGPKTSIPGFNRSCLVPNGDGTIACCLIYPDNQYTLVLGEDGTLHLCDNDSGELKKITAVHKDSRSSFMELENKGLIRQQFNLFDSTRGYKDTPFIDPAFRYEEYLVGDMPPDTLEDVTRRVQEGIKRLHFTMTSRLVKPHTMKVSVTPDLFDLRDGMIRDRVLRRKTNGRHIEKV